MESETEMSNSQTVAREVLFRWNVNLARKNLDDVEQLCVKRRMSRSAFIRDLVERELAAAREKGEIGRTDEK
jgi:metal-responsive CopG/Arc/MetJ family transcriptional regulator